MTHGKDAHQPRGVKIAGTGMYVPDKLLTNADLERMVDTNDEWITQRTGIKVRHVTTPDQANSDLGAAAVTQALKNAGLKPADLDLLICATMTPDVICPAMSAQIVRKIGAIPAGAFDMNIACTGFVAALNMASNAVRSGFYRHVAVVASETLTRITNYEDRGTCVLFGDGAGAAILSATDTPGQGCLYQSLGSDGERGQVLYVPRTETDIPPSGKETFTGKFNTLQMNGRAVYKFAVEKLAECVESAMTYCGMTAADIKMVIPHQSNSRMLESAWKKLGFDTDKIYMNIDRYGNTSAASVGICLHELMDQKMIGEGDHVIFVAQGGGLSWGTSLWRL
ncbi:MAG: beta-ketoacyl-ACP synthase III [Phycisphaeraceae bacterium]